jgi:hypothetical protein
MDAWAPAAAGPTGAAAACGVGERQWRRWGRGGGVAAVGRRWGKGGGVGGAAWRWWGTDVGERRRRRGEAQR